MRECVCARERENGREGERDNTLYIQDLIYTKGKEKIRKKKKGKKKEKKRKNVRLWRSFYTYL